MFRLLTRKIRKGNRMKRKINKRKFIILGVIVIFFIAYYIYYKNSNTNSERWEENLEDFVVGEDDILNSADGATEVVQDKKNLESEQIDEDNSKEVEKIIVHITGEVKNWGVIDLDTGSRVIDAVNMAGGFTENADVEKVNLAYVLTDGIKVYIPSKNEVQDDIYNSIPYITSGSGDNVITEGSTVMKKDSALININYATQTELETLPGIGPSIALKIISYREENGTFSSIEDIKNVSGIGDNKFDSIKALICV